MSDFPAATVATRRRAAGRKLIKVANSLPIDENDLVDEKDHEFLQPKEVAMLVKMMKNQEAIRIAMTKLGAKLAATE